MVAESGDGQFKGHSHEAFPEKYDVTKVINEMKSTAKTSTETTHLIVFDAILGLPKAVSGNSN